jgi:hypothetical protein
MSTGPPFLVATMGKPCAAACSSNVGINYYWLLTVFEAIREQKMYYQNTAMPSKKNDELHMLNSLQKYLVTILNKQEDY